MLESQIRKLTDRNNILQHKIESDEVRRLRTKNSHAREQKKLLEQLTRTQADAHKSHAQVHNQHSPALCYAVLATVPHILFCMELVQGVQGRVLHQVCAITDTKV